MINQQHWSEPHVERVFDEALRGRGLDSWPSLRVRVCSPKPKPKSAKIIRDISAANGLAVKDRRRLLTR